MAQRLPPYPDYRDSGLPWLGRIPAHWDVRRNGRLFAQRNETGHPDLPILEVSLRTGVRIRDFDKSKRKQVMEDRAKYKRAAAGDIAYNMMRMWQGAVGAAPTDGLVSPAYVVAAPFSETETRYYSSLFRTAAYMREVDTFSRGIVSDRNRLYWDEFKQMPSIFPPPAEQKAIADFLDAHGRLTRHFIRNKRRLIALLNERRRAIIDVAITRGLNPNVRMKSTGIKWMPEIPQHWEILSLKRVAHLHRGYDLPDDKREAGEFPVVSSAGVIGTHARAIITGPGVVTGRYGSTGRIYFIETDFWPHITSLYVSNFFGNDPRYVFYLLQTLSYEEHSAKSAVPGIDRKDLHELPVAAASRSEQPEIALFLDRALARIEQFVEKQADEIDLIRSYHERLTLDVVMGRLDIRHAKVAAGADGVDASEMEGMEEDAELDDDTTESEREMLEAED